MKISKEFLKDTWWMAMRYVWMYNFGDIDIEYHNIISKCLPHITKNHLRMTKEELESSSFKNDIKESEMNLFINFCTEVNKYYEYYEDRNEELNLTDEEICLYLISTSLYAYPRHTIASATIWDDLVPIVNNLPRRYIIKLYHSLTNRRNIGKNNDSTDAECSDKFICLLEHMVTNTAYLVTGSYNKQTETAKCIKYPCYWIDEPIDGRINEYRRVDTDKPRDCYMPINRFRCSSSHCEIPKEWIVNIKKTTFYEKR